MNWDKDLKLKQLDELLQKLRLIYVQKPRYGWLKLIRNTIGMSANILGKRTGVSQSRIATIEQAEMDGTVTLNTLTKIASGLDCDLVYFLLPKDKTLNNFRKKQAYLKALELNNYAEKQMILEEQGTSKRFNQEQIKKLKSEYLEKWPRDFWKNINENK